LVGSKLLGIIGAVVILLSVSCMVIVAFHYMRGGLTFPGGTPMGGRGIRRKKESHKGDEHI
jgi:hypothetical protein